VTSALTRRPIPALVSLLALLVLTALVWWRVLHRESGGSAAKTCPSSSSSVAPTDALPAPAQVTVQVLNSTTRTGIAAKARLRLVEDGFQSPQPATNDRSRKRILAVAEIRYGPSGAKGARLLAFYFPGARLVATSSRSATVVVSLGARYRTVASAQSVALALTRAHLTTSSPSPQPSASGC
jgi:hypothetical protein